MKNREMEYLNQQIHNWLSSQKIFNYDDAEDINKNSEIRNEKLLLLIDDPVNSYQKIVTLTRNKGENDIYIRDVLGQELDSSQMFLTMINGEAIYGNKISWDSPIWKVNNDNDDNDVIDSSYNIVRVHYPLLGGGIGDILKSIIDISKFFLLILQGIFWFVKLVGYWLPRFTIWVLSIINPYALIMDSFGTLVFIVKAILLAPLEFIVALIKAGVNKFFSFIFSVFWGWDNTASTTNDYKSKYFRSGRTDRKCYATANNGKIPFSVIVGTILCPPAGVFMEYGMTGWFQILVCIVLTCIFYIPGLLYALLLIYN